MKRLLLAAVVVLAVCSVADARGRNVNVFRVRGNGGGHHQQQNVQVFRVQGNGHVRGADAFFVTPFGVQRVNGFNVIVPRGFHN